MMLIMLPELFSTVVVVVGANKFVMSTTHAARSSVHSERAFADSIIIRSLCDHWFWSLGSAAVAATVASASRPSVADRAAICADFSAPWNHL